MSTIEKALQRKREAEARAKAEKASDTAQEQDASEVIEPVASAETRAEKPAKSKKVSTASHADGAASTLVPFNIDLDRLVNNGHISLLGDRRQINEEYREIKRKLLANAFGPLAKTLHNSNIIMVSSSRPSEGKTFTAINLALSFAAEQDKTVLLVDADVLKPNVTRTLRVNPGEGLMEYLLDENKDISDVLYRTNVDKLRIIPAGQTHHLSTELLASERMNETIDEFSNRYPDRIVIIDTPPLIGINESAVLASFAGQAVIVTEEGRTKLNDINNIVERLNPDMAVGFVVNKAVNESAENGNYYGYYYGSGPSE